jgi:hypothetical protein
MTADTPKPPDSTVHLVLRVPLVTRFNGQKLNIIDAHNEVVCKARQVALGKFGTPGSVERVKILNTQIERGRKTYLILVAKDGARFVGFNSPISSVYLGKPNAQMLSIAPAYYRKLYETQLLWFTVRSVFTPCDLQGFHLSSNGRPLLDVLNESRASSMLVEASV